MMPRMLSRLGVVILGLLLMAVPASPASAVDAAGCRVAPGYTFTFSPHCVNDKAASSYSVAFHVPVTAGTPVTRSITGDWISVVTGCGPTSAYCTVSTGGSRADREVQASVSAVGASYYFTAYIRAYCYEPGFGDHLC